MRSYLPAHVGGALDQCGAFATASHEDKPILNPQFDPATANPVAIYCIHGTLDRNNAFLGIAKSLVENNLPSHIKCIHLLTFSHRLKGVSIEDYAVQLLVKMIKYNDKNVILMGHSRGGLVASWFTENLAPSNHINVHQVFCLCAPIKGAHLAQLPFLARLSYSVDEMQPKTQFLTTLRDKILQSDTPYFFIGAKKDQIVWYDCWHPYASDAERDNLLLSLEDGHLSVLNSAEVMRWLSSRCNYPGQGLNIALRQ